MADIRLYLDANIFIYAFENNDAVARKLLEFISLNPASSPPFLATSELTLAELMVDPIRKNNDRLIEVYDNLTIGNAFIKVAPVSRDVLWHAALLRAEYASLRLPDAIHLSSAILLGCSQLLTGDMRLKETYSMAPSRHAPSLATTKISTVRPEIPTLDRLIRELTS